MLVLQRLHGGGQAAAAVDEHRGVVAVYRHDGTVAQQDVYKRQPL